MIADDGTVTLKMPLCKDCGKQHQLKPWRTDRDQGTLTFIVHLDFAAMAQQAWREGLPK
jgi:hypothetical protein